MFQVEIETEWDGKVQSYAQEMTRSRLQKVLGRMLMRYGPPQEAKSKDGTLHCFDFYAVFQGGKDASATVLYRKVDAKPVVAVVEPSIESPQIQALVAAGVLK